MRRRVVSLLFAAFVFFSSILAHHYLSAPWCVWCVDDGRPAGFRTSKVDPADCPRHADEMFFYESMR